MDQYVAIKNYALKGDTGTVKIVSLEITVLSSGLM